jgi:hypothetical protein
MEIGTSNNSHALSSEKDPTFIDSAENITLSYGYESADSSDESADSSEVSHHLQNRKRNSVRNWLYLFFCFLIE